MRLNIGSPPTRKGGLQYSGATSPIISAIFTPHFSPWELEGTDSASSSTPSLCTRPPAQRPGICDPSRLPIHDFLNDQDAGFTGRVAANCYFLTPAMPPGTSSAHTSLVVASQSNPAVSSTATNAVPELSRGSSRTPSSRSVSTGVLGVGPMLEEEEGGVLVVPPTQRPVYSHPCVFHFLECTESFSLLEEWRVHVLSHFRGQAPPTEAQCPLCSWKMVDSTRDRAWNFMLRHVVIQHFQMGHPLATSQPDFGLYRFLFNRKIINEPQFKALFMTPATGTYEQPAQPPGASPNETGHGLSNAPFIRTANEGRQRRRGLERAPRASSRRRIPGTT